MKAQLEELRSRLDDSNAERKEQSKLVSSLSNENLRLQKQINDTYLKPESPESSSKMLRNVRSEENLEVYEQEIVYNGNSQHSSSRTPNVRDDELKDLKANITRSIDSDTAIRLINLIDDLAVDLENHERQNAKLREIVLEYEEIIKEQKEDEELVTQVRRGQYDSGSAHLLARKVKEYELLMSDYQSEIDLLKESKLKLENDKLDDEVILEELVKQL